LRWALGLRWLFHDVMQVFFRAPGQVKRVDQCPSVPFAEHNAYRAPEDQRQ